MAFLGARPARPTCVAAAQAAGCRRALRACFLGGGQSWDLRRSVAAPSQQRRRQRPSPPPTVAGEPVWRGDKDVLKEDRLKLFRTVSWFQQGRLPGGIWRPAFGLLRWRGCTRLPRRAPSHTAPSQLPSPPTPPPARCTTSRPGPRTAAPSATCGTLWVGLAH